MEEHPIIMQSESVKAILEGRKTQTRRVVIDPRTRQRQHRAVSSLSVTGGIYSMGDRQRELELTKSTPPNFPCPYGQVGDRLWVRETAWYGPQENRVEYHTDMNDIAQRNANFYGAKKKPSIFMPRWASRITLEITEIRVERVREITPRDACAEGIGDFGRSTPTVQFKHLWDSINAKRGYSWESNPWVWVIGFKVN